MHLHGKGPQGAKMKEEAMAEVLAAIWERRPWVYYRRQRLLRRPAGSTDLI
jgi:hypothetical protein